MTNEDQLALENFMGTARLFPLPNLVMYPYVVQGLHIFEPRYRQMTADALAHDGLIAMVLLKPGWEASYDALPAIYSVACLGRIAADQQLKDGRYNLELRGLSRVRILEEVRSPKLYRSARVELLKDCGVTGPQAEQEVREKLRVLVCTHLDGQKAAADAFCRLLKSDLYLGTICDIMSFALPLTMATKQQLLELQAVEERAGQLVNAMERMSNSPQSAQSNPQFPPPFSVN